MNEKLDKLNENKNFKQEELDEHVIKIKKIVAKPKCHGKVKDHHKKKIEPNMVTLENGDKVNQNQLLNPYLIN